MAAYEEAFSKHATLTGTTADTVTITNRFRYLEVINRDAETPLYVTQNPALAPTTAVGAADDTFYVPPGGSKVVKYLAGKLSVVGSSNAYSVEGFDL